MSTVHRGCEASKAGLGTPCLVPGSHRLMNGHCLSSPRSRLEIRGVTRSHSLQTSQQSTGKHMLVVSSEGL